ncbi:MAG: GtrA family protein, partial [Micrococcales bacterium]|nr:GtrA family protein [Micrococcales bacterium]
AVAYVVDAGGFNLLAYGPITYFHGQEVRAGVFSGFASIIVAWLGNRYWTFRTKRNRQTGIEFAAFLAVNVVGVGIAVGCHYVSHWVLGFHSQLADNVSRNIIGVGLGTIFRYAMYKFVIFTGRQD